MRPSPRALLRSRLSRLVALTTTMALLTTTGAVPAGAIEHDLRTAGRAVQLVEDRPLGKPRPRELHVMTANVLYESRFFSVKPSWSSRRPALRSLLQRSQPHLLGTQEGTRSQVEEISDDLGTRYRRIVRTPEGESHSLAVFYDRRRLRLLASGLFQLPSRRGLLGICCDRAAMWTRFKDRRTGRRFVHVNTHLEAFSASARADSAVVLRKQVRRVARRLPVVLTGDFNEAARNRTNPVGTYHNYRGLTVGGNRIDWVLTSPGIRVRRTAVNIARTGTLFPSDHFPVQTLIRLPRRGR